MLEHLSSLSAETRFIAACCKWPHDAAAQAAVTDAIENIEDWDNLLRVCKRHRVLGFIHNAIRSQPTVPENFAAQVKRNAQIISVYGKRQAIEAVNIENYLQEHGIRSLQFKGPALAQIAYGTLSVKRSKDLDILVSAADAPRAIEVLGDLNYKIARANYPLQPALCDALLRHRNQIELINPQQMIVELHWQLANAPGLLPGIEQDLSTQQVNLGELGALTTLAEVDLFIYLCQHGALHDWARLRWLVDVAALFFAKDPGETAPLIKAAHEKGAGLAAEQAQLLCHLLFATPAPDTVSPRVQQMTDYALHRIEAPYERASLWADILFNARRWWVQRHFYPNSFAALGLLKVHRASLDDIVAVPLSAGWDWLYPVMRIPRWLGRSLNAVRGAPKK